MADSDQPKTQIKESNASVDESSDEISIDQVSANELESALSKLLIKESNDSVEVTSKFDPETAILTSSHNNTITFDKKPEVLFDPHELPRLHAAVHSTDRRLQLAAMCHFRQLLSVPDHPPISEVIRSGVLPRFIHFLQLKDDPALQFEALWSLTNITSGTSEQTKVVVRAGAVPSFVELLSSENHDVREQAVWALGNIAGDCTAYRDLLLDAHALEPLLKCLDLTRRLTMRRTATWAISNLCRGKPSPPLSQVKPALPALSQMLFDVDDELLTDACWAIFHIGDDSPEAIIEAGLIRRVVELLANPYVSVLTPALRVIGNVVAGDEAQTQVVIDAGAVPALVKLLLFPTKAIRKDACQALSNITAGSSAQIQCVLDAGAAEALVGLLSTSDFEIRCEAAWVLANACCCGSDGQIHEIVRHKFVAPLVALLSPHAASKSHSLLDALEHILRAGADLAKNEKGDAQNPYALQVARAGGISKLEELSRCKDEKISETAKSLIKGYFDGIVEEDTDGHTFPMHADDFDEGATRRVKLIERR